MSDRWELLQADAQERTCFADLAGVQARVAGPAAPPNTFRRVHRVTDGTRTWYLKEFQHTQWKNRWPARWTRPRCRTDGERERRIAEALAERGIQVARPVASGRRGAASYYLCAALPGDPIGALYRDGALDRAGCWAAARFAGGILRAGVQLPDLSADHVFRLADGAGFAVIDLHNGYLAGRPSPRLVARILRRFARSLRDTAVPRTLALGFATRLLKAAGLAARQRRAVIRRVPPMDTHGRYEVAGRSAAYRRRNPRRTARELALLERVWPGRPGDTVLDSPAGAGRLGPLLRDRFGARRCGLDRALAMLQESRRAGDPDFLAQADAAALPVADGAVDGAVVFRFLHHLPPAAARQVIAEAARVSRDYLVVTFFHPLSVHGLRRRLGELLGGRARTRHALTLRRLRGWLRAAGFELERAAADRPYLRDFWVAAFRRQASDDLPKVRCRKP